MQAAIYLPEGAMPPEEVEADLEGALSRMRRVALPEIRPSSYIETGVEVPIPPPFRIAPGAFGVFEFEAEVPDMIYSDTTDASMASMQFTPTWFDPGAVVGTSRLELAIVLPEGVRPEELRYHDVPYQKVASDGNRAIAYWRFDDTLLTGPHRVGLSFPRRAVDRVIEITAWDLLLRWWEARPGLRMVSAIVMLALLTFVYFRFTGRTGCVVWVLMMVGFPLWWSKSPAAHLGAAFAWLPLLGLMEWALRRRRQRYLPPIIHVEGGGIKRGLTAPEAAVVLERPLNEVLTLVILGLLKKGLVVRTGTGILRLHLHPDIAKASPDDRLAAAAAVGKTIHPWEQPFLDAIWESRGIELTAKDFKDALSSLIEHTADRMAGFDLEETRAYYRHIVQRAWAEARQLGTLPEERREAVLDRNVGWLFLDPEWESRWSESDTLAHYQPRWFGGVGTVRPGSESTSPLGGHVPRGQDVAASFAGWMEQQMGAVADALGPSAAVVSDGKAGVIDLSGVDSVTGDLFSNLASG
ncbi:MAG: hypothetical protein D6729_07790, partial [Deltaproteobacteria bacterium]